MYYCSDGGSKRTYYVYDKVSFRGRDGWISGFTGIATYIKDRNDDYISYPDKNYRQVSLKDLTVRSHNNNWLIGVLAPIGK